MKLRLNTTAHLSIVADHVYLYITSVYSLLMTSSWITLHVTKLKSSQTGFLNMFTSLKRIKALDPLEQLWDVEEREIHIIDVQI